MKDSPFNITRDEILNLAAQKLADQYSDESDLCEYARKLIAERVEATVKASVMSKVDAILSAEMERIMSHEIIPITIWGERCGPPTTLRAALHERAMNYWMEKVGDDGKPSTGWGATPRHEWMLKKYAGAAFDEAIKQNIINVLGALKDAIRADGYKQVDDALNELLRVKSLKEQKKS